MTTAWLDVGRSRCRHRPAAIQLAAYRACPHDEATPTSAAQAQGMALDSWNGNWEIDLGDELNIESDRAVKLQERFDEVTERPNSG